MCPHSTPCPSAEAVDHDAARVVASHPEQGWSLLCNGIILFDDTGELLPDGSCVDPCRGPAPHCAEIHVDGHHVEGPGKTLAAA